MSASDEEGYVVQRDPSNPNRTVRAKLLRYEKISGEDHEYRLQDGTRIRLVVDVENITRLIDPTTNQPAINPVTGEPVINISWGLRINTIYSERALREFNNTHR